jgi:hypothetical protein
MGLMEIKVIDVLTLVALILGPVSAVLITRWLDDRRLRGARRMDIFRTLMRTRRTPTTAEHVGALNLIEIEFANNQAIKGRWSVYYQHLAAPPVRRPNEAIEATTNPAEAASRDKAYNERIYAERQSLLAKLLHVMANELGFKIEQFEIFEGGYIPQAWVDSENEQSSLRKLLLALFGGKSSIPVRLVDKDDPTKQP